MEVGNSQGLRGEIQELRKQLEAMEEHNKMTISYLDDKVDQLISGR